MHFAQEDTPSPVAIGGVGGSGTRLIASIIQQLGFYMGSDLNNSMDNLLFTLLFKREELWPIEQNKDELEYLIKLFAHYMHKSEVCSDKDIKHLEFLTSRDRLQHKSDWLKHRLDKLLDPQRTHDPNKFWGWKEPNTHIFLPTISKAIPNLKYIHVMRHGLDMAYSPNQNQVKLWGAKIFGESFDPSTAESSFRYWVWAHKRIAEIGGKLGDSFFCINFEEFCALPERGISQVADFLDLQLPQKVIQQLARDIKQLESKKRYLNQLDFKPANHDIEILKSFGYKYSLEEKA